jgi:ABC-2 type transport system permease protein
VNPYVSLFAARFRALLQYRLAAVAGFGTQLFWGFLRVMIFTAFYRSTTKPPPISLPDMVSYLWLTQAFFALSLNYVDPDVRAMMRNGTVAYEMVRPLDLYSVWLSTALAARIAPTVLRAVPMLLVAWLLLGLRLPPGAGCALATAAGIACAFLLTAALSVVVTASLFHTVSGEGLARFMPVVVYIFSGILVPLPLLPGWMQSILDVLPFRGIADIPYRLYLGTVPASDVPLLLAHQLAWTIALVLLGKLMLRRSTRRLVVQGG